MRTWLAFAVTLLCLSSPLLAAPHRLVDYDFGTQAVAWKNDGSQLALQDSHGIAIRDGKTLKLLHYLPLASDSDGFPRLQGWSEDKLFLEKIVPHQGGPYLGFTSVLVLSSQSGKTLATWPSVEFSPANPTLWFHRGSHFRVFSWEEHRWFDVNLPLRVQDWPGEIPDKPAQITFSKDGRFAADQLNDGRMRLWNVAARKVTTILEDAPNTLSFYPHAGPPVAWSPDGKRVATFGEDPSHVDFTYDDGGPNDGTQNRHPPVVKIWDVHSGKRIQWFNGQTLSDSYYEDSTRGSQILDWLDSENLIIGEGGSFEVRHIKTEKSVAFGDRLGPFISPDKSRLFTSARLIEIGKQGQMRVLKSLFPAPSLTPTVAWSRDGCFIGVPYNISTANGDRLSQNFTWNVSELSLEQPNQSHQFLPWGGRIYEYEWSPTTVIGDVSESKGGSILAFSPDARKVLRLGQYGIRIFDRQDHVLASLTSNVTGVNSAQFSPNGKYIALARANFVEIYAAQSAQLVAKLYGWVRSNPTPGTDWLSLRPNGEAKGTEVARKQVALVP
jgi:hypothetical protein